MMLAPYLIGREAEEREGIYDDLKREARQFDHMGHGPIDIALWDLAGKKLGASVSRVARRLSQAPAGLRQHLSWATATAGLTARRPTAISRACYEMGYRAFKIHGWNEGDKREEADNLLHVRKPCGRQDGADDRSCLRAAHLRRCALRRPRLRRSRLLLVRGSVSRQRYLGLRAQEAARDDQDADSADRARPRGGAQGGFPRRRRDRFPARRSRVRHGHHRLR